MLNRILFVFVALLFVSANITAEDYISLVKKGNESFKQNDYKKAMEYYRNAETEIPESPELNYNIGSTLHKEGKFEEAVEILNNSLRTTDINLESSAHFNLGNTHFRMQDYQNAIKSFEKSLSLNPKDMDAKFNLELARKKLKEQMEKQKQDKKQDQKQDQKEQEQKQDQQQQQDQQNEQDQQQKQKQEQQQQEKQDDQNKEQQQQKQEEPKEMSKEDAERILNALKDEQDIQKNIKRVKAGGNYSGKDW